MKPSLLLIGLVFLLYLGHIASAFYDNPPPWPDEALYTDIARTILTQGKAATSLWQGVVPQVEERALWYPQPYFYALAGWYHLFGFSVFSMRSLAVVMGIFVVVMVVRISQLFSAKRNDWWVLLPGLALVLDYQFVRATRIQRPEMWVLVLVLLAWWLAQVKLKKGSRSLSYRWLIVGFILGLAVLLHLLASVFAAAFVIWLLWDQKGVLQSLKQFVVGISAPLAAWVIWVWPVRAVMWQQLNLMAQRKALEKPWILLALEIPNPLLQIISLSLLVISLVFVYRTIKQRQSKQAVFLALLLSAAWVIAWWGKMFWYIVYVLPFAYLALKELAQADKRWRWLTAGLLLCLVGFSWKTLSITKGGSFSVQEYYTQILAAVPEGKIVFLSSIPDPYFAFIEAKRTNRLFEFPSLPLTTKEYADVLAQTDYVVYSNSYDRDIMGNYLADYLELNSQKETLIGQSTGYTGKVVQLVPIDARTEPR